MIDLTAVRASMFAICSLWVGVFPVESALGFTREVARSADVNPYGKVTLAEMRQGGGGPGNKKNEISKQYSNKLISTTNDEKTVTTPNLQEGNIGGDTEPSENVEIEKDSNPEYKSPHGYDKNSSPSGLPGDMITILGFSIEYSLFNIIAGTASILGFLLTFLALSVKIKKKLRQRHKLGRSQTADDL